MKLRRMLTGLAILSILSVLIGIPGDVAGWLGYGQAEQPDLKPGEIRFDPPSPAWQGAFLTITATVENVGEEMFEQFRVKFLYFHEEVAGVGGEIEEILFPIGTGGKKTIEVYLDTLQPPQGKPKLIAGTYRIIITVDSENNIAEEDETNNKKTISLILKACEEKPDLELRNIAVAQDLLGTPFPSPLNAVRQGEGEKAYITTDMINIGAAEATERFDVVFSHYRRGGTEFVEFDRIPYKHGLNRGALYAVQPRGSLDTTDLDAGVYIIKVEADSDHAIDELSEDNNMLITSIFIVSTRMSWSFPDLFDSQAPAVGAIESSPKVGDGTIFIGSNDGGLYAINAFTGRERAWSPFNKASGPIRSSPTIRRDDEGKIIALYFGSDDGNLYAVNPNNGQLLWDSPFLTAGPGAIRTTPAIGQGGEGNSIVYFGSDDGHLYAIYSTDGTEEWQKPFATGASVRSSPAIVEDGTIYFGSDDGYLYALNPDGTERWHFLTGGPVRSSLARDTGGKTYISPDGTVYFGSDDGNLYAVNIETPTEKWKFRTDGPIESVPTVQEDRNGTPIIYFGSFDGHLYAVRDEGNKGTEKWQYPKENREPIGSIKSSPAMGADGAIYFGSDDGNIYALEDDGGERWIFPTASFVTSSPAMGEGDVLFIGSWDGHLYAIDLKR